MTVLGALASALCAGSIVWLLVEPPRPVRRRIRPYLASTGTAALWAAHDRIRRTFARVVWGVMAERLGAAVDGLSRGALDRRLRQAGLFQQARDPAGAYRLRQLLDVVVATAGAGVVGVVVGMTAGQTVGLALLGLVVGLTRQRGAVTRAIEARRQRMVIEIYTVDQVLALRVRAGGGVMQAVSAIVATASGEVVGELREALRLHRAGMPASEAFRRIADATPEPACARTYSFLSLAEERGTDLGDALLSLADDVREARREAIRRAATRRRAAMLVPTVAVLAPVMLLFVGAPLPSLVLGFT